MTLESGGGGSRKKKGRPHRSRPKGGYDVPNMTPEFGATDRLLAFQMLQDVDPSQLAGLGIAGNGVQGYKIAPQITLHGKNESPYRQDTTGMKIAPQKSFGPGTEQPEASTGRIVRGNRTAPQDTLDRLFQQLTNYIQNSGVSFDYESALKQSQEAIRRAYAADIKAVRMGKRQARRETAAGRRELEQLYGALGQSYEDMGQKQFRQGRQAANIMDRRADRSANNVENNAEAMLAENAALAEGLGIEQGLIEENNPMLEEAMGTAADIRQTGNKAFNRGIKNAQNNRNYMNRQAVTSELEGTNRQADLVGDLQDYLQQSNRDIAGIRGARAHEIAQNRATMQSQASQMSAEAEEAMWNRLMDVAGLKLDIESERADQSYNNATLQQRIAEARARDIEESTGLPVPDYYQDFNSILASAGPRRAPGLKGFMNQILGGDEFSGGRFEAANGDLLKLTPTQAVNIVVEEARAAGIPPADIEILKLATLAYMEGQ